MKIILNGVRYNTENAIKVVRATSDALDHNSWEAALYVTPRAERYFLAGKGGPLTRFSAGNWSRGSKIIPLSKTDAMDWAANYMTPEAFEAQFTD